MPPYLAGRQLEFREFERLLAQDVILENLILTGLRGTGKTVLLETFKPRAIAEGWLWAGTDMTGAACTTESALAQRLLSDLAIITSGSPIAAHAHRPMGFAQTPTASPVHLTYDVLESVYAATPGLVSDKVKAVLEFTWDALSRQGPTKIIFAYDEAQNLSNNAAKGRISALTSYRCLPGYTA